jgi:hypothetical protein
MSLTVQQSLEAYQVLKTLIESDKQNKFVFASSVRLKFSRQFAKLKNDVDAYKAEHAALVTRLGKQEGDRISVDANGPEAVAEFNKENSRMLSQKTETELVPVKDEELGDNQIPMDLLAVMVDVGLLTK